VLYAGISDEEKRLVLRENYLAFLAKSKKK